MAGGFDNIPEEATANGNFIVSLADALTCVFGAAIALFVIFLVLVKLDPDVTRANAPTDELARQAFASSAFEKALLSGASVTLVFAADRCSDVEGIRLTPAPPAVEYWLSPQGEGHNAERCRLYINLPDGFQSAITLASPRAASSIRFSALVGNFYSKPLTIRIGRPRRAGLNRFGTFSQSGEFRSTGIGE